MDLLTILFDFDWFYFILGDFVINQSLTVSQEMGDKVYSSIYDF